MIPEFFMNLGLDTLNQIFGILPVSNDASNQLAVMFLDFTNIFGMAASFLPMDLILVIFGNIIFWLGIHLAISIIRFIKSFIPLMG